MKGITFTKHIPQGVLQPGEMKSGALKNNKITEAFAELERGIYCALETYSNVHRGSGHNSIASTLLYEQSRDIVLEYLGLRKGRYLVIFCTPGRAEILTKKLEPTSYKSVSSQDIGLAIGIKALAVRKNALPGGIPFQTGGGTAKLMSKSWVIWAGKPEKFEAGTPAIINVIAFAKALRMIQQSGEDIFKGSTAEIHTAAEILYTDELMQYSGKELLDELRKTLIGQAVRVPTMEGDRPFINLDNSASTPTFTPVWNAFRQTWRQHRQVQQEIVHEVKSICSEILGAPLAGYDVMFTSNTTEAINLTAESMSREYGKDVDPVVLNTILEHSSNDLPWRTIPRNSLIRLGVDADGFFDLNELETLLCSYNEKFQYGKKRIKIVAVSGASNVLGVCNNIDNISQIVHRFGAHLLVDAAQLTAHRKVDMEGCGIDYLAFSAHKVYAPFGCGVLLVRKGLLNFNTGEMEMLQSSGEENAAGIAALGKALVLLKRIGMDLIQKEEQALTARTLRGLAQIQGLTMYGIKDPESPEFTNKIGVIVFILNNMMSNKVANELALRSGIGVRYGCHCAHIIVKRILSIPPFLEQFQRLIQTLFPKLRLPGVVRVSLGVENSTEEIDKLIHILGEIARHTRSAGEKKSASSQNKESILPHKNVQQQINDFTETLSLKVFSQL